VDLCVEAIWPSFLHIIDASAWTMLVVVMNMGGVVLTLAVSSCGGMWMGSFCVSALTFSYHIQSHPTAMEHAYVHF
jgi:hypothetical protein